MKKSLFLFSLILILSGCQLWKDGQASINNLKEEADRVIEEVNEVKEKAQETAKDISDAVDKVKDAAEAVSEITD